MSLREWGRVMEPWWTVETGAQEADKLVLTSWLWSFLAWPGQAASSLQSHSSLLRELIIALALESCKIVVRL